MKTDLGESDRAVAINPEAVDEARYAFMDGVHFQHHLGADGQAAPLYASVVDVLKYEPCAAECGVVKVKVVAMSWPIAQNLEPAAPEAPADARSDQPIATTARADWKSVGAQVGAAPPLTDERAAFEKFVHEVDARYDLETYSAGNSEPDGYVLEEIDLSWMAWQARAAMQHPSGGDQRTEGSGSSDRAQAEAVRRPVGGDDLPPLPPRRTFEANPPVKAFDHEQMEDYGGACFRAGYTSACNALARDLR